MIDARELRLGNYVWNSYSGYMVVSELRKESVYARRINFTVGGSFLYENISPIPLSPEVLMACGFAHEEKESRINDMKVFHVYTLGDFTFNSNHGWWFNGKQLDHQPEFLHQLQNLYYALTNQELNYKP